jgi:ATP adenylyltransferase
MEYIWAPWRIEYIQSEKLAGCILCDKPKEDKDTENYILYRGKKNFIMLNSYPYNPGHLLIAPYRHIETPERLTVAERNEDHFHSHIVPRWQGDTNYIPVLADIRVVPQALADTYKVLVGMF